MVANRRDCGCERRGQCIVPPHLLEQIARHGTPEQRDWALRTLSLDFSFRSRRLQASRLPGASRPSRSVAAPGSVQPLRTIYDAEQSETLPGREVRAEGGLPTEDLAVNQAYDGLGSTFAFFRDVLGRNSIDDAGRPLLATVHFSTGWDNASWNGEQMIFGDGDGTYFGSFTAALDVIGHELTHGVTEDEAQLLYLDQSGALNESISDCFGSLVRQYAAGETAAQADWLIGPDLILPGFGGRALRSMKEPGTAYDDPVLGKDPQPGHLRDYVVTAADNGGVHINSGIPNRAFATAALALGGSSWQHAGPIWYDALRDDAVTPETGFDGFAAATVRAAQRGFGEPAAATVRGAWGEVGIDV